LDRQQRLDELERENRRLKARLGSPESGPFRRLIVAGVRIVGMVMVALVAVVVIAALVKGCNAEPGVAVDPAARGD
jgi:hypothetical protein